MGKLEKAAVLMALALVASACSGDDDDSGLDAIDTPTFADDDADAGVTTSTVGSDEGITTSTVDSGATTSSVAGGSEDQENGAGSTGRPPIESVSFDDPVGDATPGVGTGSPPPWSDLAGGSLERQGNAYRLTIRLGGEAPQTADGAETMNIATFFDVDGDGGIEYELWVNLGQNGWGPVWYDDEGNAAPGEASNVTVIIEGDEVRLLFPDVMIDKPERLRFSLASEYGELAQIGSSFARRDDAPDGERSVAFPTRS